MPVFKAYFTVIRKIFPSLIVYFVVFIIMTSIFVKLGGGTATEDFTAVKNNIAIQSEDSSVFVDGLIDYLGQHATLVDIKDEGDNLKDALFYGKVDDVLKIPAGFTDRLMSGSDDLSLERASYAMSGSAVNTELLIGRYLDLARLHVLNVPDITQEELVSRIALDLEAGAQVDMMSGSAQLKTGDSNDTFRYMAYSILAILIMGITSIMMAFNSPEVARRNLCAPVSPARMNVQLFAGNLIFTVAVWVVLCLFSYVLSAQAGFGPGLLLMYLNTLVFSIAALSIAFLAGKIIKSQIAQAAATNVVSLGISFLSGVFVPQFLLSDTVLRIASFTPGYWYVKAVDSIKSLSVYSFDNLKPIFSDMLVQLGFAAAFFILALVASKQKRQSANS